MYNGLYEYLKQCPQLAGQTFNFDFVGSVPVQWTLAMPDNIPELSKDIQGNAICQLNFMIISISNFGDAPNLNMENLEIFQTIKRWLSKQNRIGNFPDLGTDKEVTGVFANSDPALETTTENVGRYQIFCRVEYKQLNTSPKKMPTRW